jgi:hypothetical protein
MMHGSASLAAAELAYFDAARCAKGLEALREYKAEWDDDLRTFKKTPKHDWASHAADSWRYLSMAWRQPFAAEDEKADPVKELLKPRTYNDMWRMYVDEQDADDLPEYAHEFNLNSAAD